MCKVRLFTVVIEFLPKKLIKVTEVKREVEFCLLKSEERGKKNFSSESFDLMFFKKAFSGSLFLWICKIGLNMKCYFYVVFRRKGMIFRIIEWKYIILLEILTDCDHWMTSSVWWRLVFLLMSLNFSRKSRFLSILGKFLLTLFKTFSEQKNRSLEYFPSLKNIFGLNQFSFFFE